MGERKGTNLYYPPDYDPRVGGLNKFMGTHALRERARKLHMGILIIRFEMPFNIWCNGCNNHIGMGVRYNAEKKKIGMYYSTPLYQFRMKCHLCDNHFEIKTDPANLTYIVESGARRQENRWDPTENEQVVPEEKEVSRRLYDDPMFKLEHSMDDKKKAKSKDTTLSSLIANNEQFKDDYALNSSLRAAFREKKKELQERKSLSSKLGLVQVNLVDEHDEDIKLAKLLMHSKKSDGKKKSIYSPLKKLVNSSHVHKMKKQMAPSASTSLVKKIKNQRIQDKVSSSSSGTNLTASTSLVNYDSSSSSDNT
ncbi:coiled-coil domain-containing protein 130 homolog [Microplitis mediator]|uniref:coiled-coil domain-containing protein 130 homolog n=1 Tax=Microplitis mediator TaxID=375433 RepID=UPI0025577228|nr:coiled-coil domain-containing protein 130 homolog [Microplitis mediator]XP_057335807.1 coiled-coil domain-containing protein 130 homolog [Microplitis mediator]